MSLVSTVTVLCDGLKEQIKDLLGNIRQRDPPWMVAALAGPGAEPAATRLGDVQIVTETETKSEPDALFQKLKQRVHSAPVWDGPSLAAGLP